MSAVDSVLRLIAAPVALAVIIFSSWVGVKLMDPYTTNMPAPAASLGWPAYSTIYHYMALALVGLTFVTLAWLWFARIRQDTRQELQPRDPF